MIEVEIAKHMSDKTNWRKMLKNEVDQVNLSELREELLKKIREISRNHRNRNHRTR